MRNLGTVSDSEDVPAKIDWYSIITLYSQVENYKQSLSRSLVQMSKEYVLCGAA